PSSRSLRDSPTQTIGVKPASSAALVFCATPESVSPKNWRRSECPIITYWQPASFSIAAETSPVKAPSLRQSRFCALMPTLVPSAISTATQSDVYGGAITMSESVTPETKGSSSSKNERVSSSVLYIFQLPAVMRRRFPAIIGWSAPQRREAFV